MTSRERVRAALRREAVDRMPIDFGGTGTSGISIYVYNEARRILGLGDEVPYMDEPLSQLARIAPDMTEAMGGDTVVLWRQSPCLGLRIRDYVRGALMDGSPAWVPDSFAPQPNEKGDLVYHKALDDHIHPYLRAQGKAFDAGVPVAVCPRGQAAFSRVYHPLAGVETPRQLMEYQMPLMDAEELADIGRRAKHLHTATDKALCGVFNGNPFEQGQLYWGYEEFFVNLMVNEELMDCYFEMRMACMMEDLEHYLGQCGDYIEAIEFTEDFGTQSSLLISPDLYRERIKPLHRRMFDLVHARCPQVKVLLHSCGAISELIPDFIEIGVDALNPVQISATGMEPEKLVRTFGRDITFWGGGVDTQSTLCLKPPAEVRREVEHNLAAFSKADGYIFTQVHNVEASVPGENLVAAFQTAKAAGQGRAAV